ncbi:HNH endonuclease [Fagus crenata]
MAQFVTQGRLKLLFSRDGVSSFGFEPKDPFHYYLRRSVQTHFHTLTFLASTTTLFFSTSSYVNKSTTFNSEARLSVSVSDSETVYDDDDDVDHNDDLACFRGLVLDISYRPVNVVCWKRAICLEFMEKVPHLLQVVKRRRIKNTLSRKNILYRDNYTCQYCSSRENLTIDHVLPAARGGQWKWENLVAACAKCNSKKGQKTVEEANMKLIKVPKAPKDFDILAIPLTSAALKMLKMRKGTPEEWRQYLSKPSSET